jgi:hypothetical protein
MCLRSDTTVQMQLQYCLWDTLGRFVRGRSSNARAEFLHAGIDLLQLQGFGLQCS